MMRLRREGLAVVVLLLCAGCAGSRVPAREVRAFALRLDTLRRQNHIPGMSGAVVRDGKVVWAKGFGYADVEQGREAAPETIYPLASLTKTFASTIMMQLIEEGAVSLDDPVSKYGIDVDTLGVVRVRHLLSHTSQGVPGAAYAYSGSRYGLLGQVMQQATGKSFGQLLVERIIHPLGLEHTAPNPADTAAFALTGYDRATFERQVASGYNSDGIHREAYPAYFGTAAGLFSNVYDLAKYATALDDGRLLSPEAKALAWSPTISNSGTVLPYGLGWFVYDQDGPKLVWHYGLWNGHSALLLKVPEQKLTFILLANSDMLSRPYPLWEDSNVLKSPFARAFYDTFVQH
ncbi:MAG TPA: serine hydrolase domain-containing protein [Rhodothermales bacterium]|nr:serine hydrolase domain-containing protein [Rhodothermales bacterium]